MTRALAIAWWVTSALSVTVALVLEVLSRGPATAPEFGFPPLDPFLALTTATVGLVVAARRPENPIGWLFCLSGFAQSVDAAGGNYVAFVGATGPRVEYAAWVTSWIWLPGTLGAMAMVAVLFPDGSLPSRRWRPVPWLVCSAVSLGIVGLATDPAAMVDAVAVPNPFGVAAMTGMAEPLLGLPVLALLVSTCALVGRFRRARGVTRQQIKWLGAGIAALLLSFAAMILTQVLVGRRVPLEMLVQLSVATIPIAAGIAVTRFRLYEIDRIINRTIVYATLTALLVGAYALIVVGAQLVLRPLEASSDLAIAASTLGVAALFRPARRRVQETVDRRFDRSRYDAARTLQSFTAKVRDEIDLDTLVVELETSVDSALRPRDVQVWLPR